MNCRSILAAATRYNGRIRATVFIGLLTAGLAFISASTAMSADLPPNRPSYPVVAPVGPYDWSGFYLGVHAGYGRSESTFNLVDVTPAVFLEGLRTLNPKSSGLLGVFRAAPIFSSAVGFSASRAM